MQTDKNHHDQLQRKGRDNSLGTISIVFFVIFIFIMLALLTDKGPGGWSWGYGVQYLIYGFFVLMFGTLIAIISFFKSSSRKLSTIGLILCLIPLILLSPIAPLATEMVWEKFSSGKPSPTDRAWYLMESNRDLFIKCLPETRRKEQEITYRFLESINSQLSKNEGREIEKIIVQFQSEAGVIPDPIRSQNAMNSLALIADKHKDLRSWYDETFGGKRGETP